MYSNIKLPVIASEAKQTRLSIVSNEKPGLLRFARNDGDVQGRNK